MTMSLEEPGRLRVVMEQNELERFDLTFKELNYDYPKTRQLLNALLIKAARTTEFKLTPGRLFIEAFPTETGGCIIYFTVRTDPKRSRVFRRKRFDTYIFEFLNTENMMDGIGAAFKVTEGQEIPASLWGYREKFRLQVEQSNNTAAVFAVLNEYADAVYKAKSELLATREHGCCLCENNAIFRIGSAMDN